MHTVSFDDYHAYADAINRVDARFMLHRPEKYLWRISNALFPGGMRLQYCYSGSGAIAQGAGERDGVALAIPAFGHFVANGEAVGDDAALFILPRQEFLVSVAQQHSWFNVFLPHETAEEIGLPANSAGPASETNCVLHSSTRNTCMVRPLLLRYISTFLPRSDLQVSVCAQERFEAELLAAVRATYGSPPPPSGKQVGRRATADKAAILRVIELINATPSPQFPLRDLATVADASERALRDGFQRYIGVSPSRYMQLRMMDQARRQLLAAHPGETTVARIATDLGACDLGRFAARYRQLFGELPSATLKEAKWAA